ncbi:MAG: class I SAM-dependent methyltransferase [Patescibacteria group bacterium]|nr:class I SAM-dependent methyltransferase [Patescibacteria group bacterium]
MSFLDPQKVLNELNVEKNFIAADFGCGSGGWVFPLAKMLENGKVYAIDILKEPLSALRSKMKTFKVLNIELIQADVEKHSKLLSESCDLVLLTNLLFGVEDIDKILQEVKRVLKPKGQVLIVDWLDGSNLGPEKKISADDVKQIAQKLEFQFKKEFKAGIYHWGLIIVK